MSTATPDASGHIYVINFSGGIVKVGSTRTPTTRLRQHESDAAAFGRAVVGSWLSERHSGYLASESALIAYATSRAGRRLRREYFQEVDISDLRRMAEALTASNGKLAVTIETRDTAMFPLSQVRAMHPYLDIRDIRWKCAYQQVPSEVRNREFCLTRATIAELVRAHAEANPSRSLRYRLERRAA